MNEITNQPIYNIDLIEAEMLSLPQVSCPVNHKIINNHYIREVFLPKGALCIGHYQKQHHINYFVSGSVRMINEDGSTKDLHAPMVFVGNPGRKIGLILEDVIWQNIYYTNETDIEKCEDLFLDKSEYFLQQESLKFIEDYKSKEIDRLDFIETIKELNIINPTITEKSIYEVSINDNDKTHLPEGHYKFIIKDSPIHGLGVFAESDYEQNEIIGFARIGDKRTVLGRYTNHSKTPNAIIKFDNNGNYNLIAISKIKGKSGGQSGEEITVDYRQVYNENIHN